MPIALKQSTAVTVSMGPALDVGGNEKTALTPTVELSKAGAAYGARSSASAITHDQNGHYRVPLDATDTGTLGPLRIKFDDSANHLPVWHDFVVMEAQRYAALYESASLLPVDVKAWLNTQPLALNAQMVIARVESASATSLDSTNVKADTAAIKLKTDNLPANPASQTKLDTLHDVRIPGVVQPQSGDAFARLGAPAGASIAADIAAVNTAATAGILIDTTIATLTSQTIFTLSAGSSDNDAYNGHDVIITDAVSNVQKTVSWVASYAGATKSVTLSQTSAFPVFTIAVGDRVVIKARTSLRGTDHTRTLDVNAAGNAGIDWSNIAQQGATVNLSATTVGVAASVTALSAGAIASIWNALTSGMTTAGSIGKKLADWTVGQVISLTQAALAMFATTDTGQTTAAAGSVAQLSQGSGGGGGGGTIVMGPLVAVREPGNRIMSPMKLEMWKGQNKQFDIAVVDADGAPVSLVGKTLRFVVGDTQLQPVGVFDVEAGASIVIASNVASVSVTGAQAAVASTERQWWLWSLNDPASGQHTVLAWGPFEIRGAVFDV